MLYTYNYCSSQLRENKQKLLIAYLTRWHRPISIFGEKLRTIETKIFKKLRTVSFNSEVIGSY